MINWGDANTVISSPHFLLEGFMKRKMIVLITMILCYTLMLTSCQPTPSNTINSESAQSAVPLNPQLTPKDEQNSVNSNDFSANLKLVHSADGKMVEETLTTTNGEEIILNATVTTKNVENVQQYQYVSLPITDNFRKSLFTSVLGDKAADAEYDARNDVWELRLSNKVGDYYLYETGYFLAGKSVAEQTTFSLEYRYVDLYPFDDNILSSIEQSPMTLSADEAVSMCNKIMDQIANGTEYQADYVFAYGTNGRHPYYKIVYKQEIDDTIITAFNDIYFLVDDSGVQKVFGCLYEVGNTILTDPIISVDKAVESLKDSIFQMSFQEFDNNTLTVNEITLEYIVVNADDGKAYIRPAWRFVVGENEEQQNRYRDRIIAIDAVTGDLIQGRRGNSF